MGDLYLVLFVVLAVGWCVPLYRAAKKNGVDGFKGYFNAQTLGLPDSMRPFNVEHETSETLTPKELVLTDDPEQTHRRDISPSADDLPSGWVKVQSRERDDTTS
jgi:hypothetical protein